MKRLFSIFMSILLVCGIFSVNAEEKNSGYGDSYANAEDNLMDCYSYVDNFDKDYAVAFNDFEAVNNYSGHPIFPIEDTGEHTHGKAFCIPARTGAAVPGSGALGTYSWNDSTYELFYEVLESCEDYIFAYEYWSDPTPESNSNSQKLFSVAPCHKAFLVGTDYRHYPKYYGDNDWHEEAIAFTATANEKDEVSVGDRMNVKINTLGSNIKSYLDNYLVMKAGEFVLDDVTNSITLNVLSENVIHSDSEASYNGKTTFALGTVIKFKLESNNPLVTAGVVKMGETELQPDSKGVYTVKAIDDLHVSATVDTSILAQKYLTDDNDNIYFSEKISIYELSETIGVPDVLVAKRNGEAVARDVYLKANDKLFFSVNSTVQYNVKYIGDIADGGDGEFTVSDAVALIDRIYGVKDNNVITEMYDLNGSETITVSDVICLRKKILENVALLPDRDVAADMKAYVSDILVRSGTGATISDLDKAIYSNGNRAAVANVIRKAIAGEKISIVYFGGSITAMSGNDIPIDAPYTGIPDVTSSIPSFSTSITKTGGYVSWITEWFKRFFPEAEITTFNAGIASTDTPIAVHRMVEDVLQKEPDLVINEWACNDDASFKYKQGTYEAVVKRLLEKDIAVLLYGFATRSGGTSQELHKPIANHYKLPFVSYKDAYFTNPHWQYFTNDATHPNIVGHALAGATINHFLQQVYENINCITTKVSSMPLGDYHSETHYYEGAYLASFKDIYDQKIDGVKIRSMGSFTFEEKTLKFGCRSFNAATAVYSEEFQPMVIEIDVCKTMFILAKLQKTSVNPDGAYYIKINDEQISRTGEFTCSQGDSTNGYMWATGRIMYEPTAPKVILEIHPNFTNSAGYVSLFALLLS